MNTNKTVLSIIDKLKPAKQGGRVICSKKTFITFTTV